MILCISAVTEENLVESLVRDMRAYCLVVTDMLELVTIPWYQVTTSISDTAEVARSPQGSRVEELSKSIIIDRSDHL